MSKTIDKEKNFSIPKEVLAVLDVLKKNKFEAFVVGGSVRDLILGREPCDWDVTTNATPEELVKIFPDSFYENNFLTVTVKTGSDDPRLSEVEITTYRAEGRYSDQRHPDEERDAKTLEEDLSSRDFTVNAIALFYNLQATTYKLIDPFGGQKDLENKIIRAVGNPGERFEEDALRMLRAV